MDYLKCLLLLIHVSQRCSSVVIFHSKMILLLPVMTCKFLYKTSCAWLCRCTNYILYNKQCARLLWQLLHFTMEHVNKMIQHYITWKRHTNYTVIYLWYSNCHRYVGQQNTKSPSIRQSLRNLYGSLANFQHNVNLKLLRKRINWLCAEVKATNGLRNAIFCPLSKYVICA